MSTLCGTGSVRSADGTVIGFEVDGAGPPLLLVHGSSGTRGRWAPVRTQLAAHHLVFAIDRRGRGLSAAEAGPYDLQREAEDVAAVAESIGAKVFVVGHSFGALTVMEAALRTRAFERIVLYEPPMSSPGASAVTPAALAAITATTDPRATMTTFYEQTLQASPAVVERLMNAEFAAVASSATRTIAREVEAVLAYRATARLGRIGVPVRMLLGTESPTYLRAATAMVAARIDGATITAFEGQGHQGIEGDPDQFVRAVLAFDVNDS